jgi:hypothetical protein
VQVKEKQNSIFGWGSQFFLDFCFSQGVWNLTHEKSDYEK